jgi:glycerophosphoryl diester phosphodiesterase
VLNGKPKYGEESLAAYKRAQRVRARAGRKLTGNGVPVAIHDARLDRTTHLHG